MSDSPHWLREFTTRNAYAVAIGIVATLLLSLFLAGDALHGAARATFRAIRMLIDALL